jgi:hypothetical protein
MKGMEEVIVVFSETTICVWPVVLKCNLQKHSQGYHIPG